MLTVDDLREHVTSTLEDGALEMLLGAAYEIIDERVGSDADVTEIITAGPGPLLLLSRKASAVVSVAEGIVDLDATDYELRGRLLWRLNDGANPGSWWRDRIEVTYTPIVFQDSRDLAAVSLVKLTLTFAPGAQSERIGDWTETLRTDTSYIEQRDEILAALTTSGLVIY